MTMKCEHGVVSALILRDCRQSYIQLGCASLICMLLCVESLAGHKYICMLCGERLACFLSQGYQHLEWLWRMSLPVLSQSVDVCSSPAYFVLEYGGLRAAVF